MDFPSCSRKRGASPTFTRLSVVGEEILRRQSAQSDPGTGRRGRLIWAGKMWMHISKTLIMSFLNLLKRRNRTSSWPLCCKSAKDCLVTTW